MTLPMFVSQLGWVLLDFVWQGALIGCETALLLLALRNARAETRYLVACSGLLLCLLWPAATLVLRLSHGADAGASALPLGPLLAGGATQADSWRELLQGNLSWMVGAWALCAAALALRMVLGLLWIGRAARHEGGNAQWQARLDTLARGFGIARAVRLQVVDGLASPVTAGWWKPVVLVPASLVSGMPPQLLEALLAHELAHVRRCDYLVNLVQSVIETLLFYHPAVWWISHRVRVEREHIADDLAARRIGEPRRLALALSELEKLQFSNNKLAMAANGGDLMQRIKRLVRPDMQALNWKAAIPVLGLSATLLVGCAQTPMADSAADAVTTPPLAQFNSCAKPMYPAEALAKRLQGTVTLQFKVEADGSVQDSKVMKSSGDASLDEAARVAIAKCTFTPATVNGKPKAAWAPVQYVWSLS
ncbi:M56 family metallopeptidase [Massilia sp. IC2-278]|uniref:M56 family metallopeptidase n=1 Tax=Massilia sp. IC2-278 TaxID=2887200 RepID=UPI001E585D2C|nr:M56 family metallopeptidase [Massilia sp. IC2-278]MCC2960370.1 M56 family metallopeptidase [Massilia sp. IC2-278]